jgi:tRNA (cytidine/uridine-2'-O-)-methyltransferase
MSSHAEKSYLDIEFQDGDWLVFGKESVGLSQEVIYLTRKINSKSHVIFDSSFNTNSVAFFVGVGRGKLDCNSSGQY